MDTPTPIAPPPTFWSTVLRIASSRKGVGAFVTTAIGSVYALGLCVSYFQGKLTPDSFFTHLQTAGGVVTAGWLFYIGGTAAEDMSAKRAPSSLSAIGDHASVQSNRPMGSTAIVDASEKPTPVETPDGKRAQ